VQLVQGAQVMDKDTSVCTKPCIRKEIHDLTPDEFINFIDAFRKVKQSSFWDHLTKIHLTAQNYAHFTPIFLPYHRLLLELMEKEMQKYYPGLCMPYWNWGLDSQDPEKSIVFTSAYFGGNGVWPNYDVTTGPFINMTFPYPQPGKLKRDFDDGTTISSLLTPENLQIMINEANTYDDFNYQISLKPHADVHDNVGGEYGHLSTMASPSDPIFFLHHCFLDNLWWNWQKKSGALALSYSGIDASKFDNIIPWGTPVYKVLNTTSYGTCYVYPEYKVALPQTVKVPTRHISNPNPNPNLGFGNLFGLFRSKKKPIDAGSSTKSIEDDEEVEEMPLSTLIERVSKGEIEGESVAKRDRSKQGKARTLKQTSTKTQKMFKINPEDEKRQREHFDLINKSLNIAKNHKSKAELRDGDPLDRVPQKLKKWAKHFKKGLLDLI
jgi:tyrosinase